MLSKAARVERRIVIDEAECKKQVYDIRNCGKRHRFCVFSQGQYFIVSNCVQSIARDALVETMLNLEKAGFEIVFHIHDETVIEARPNQTLEQIEEIFSREISWAKGLPLKGAGYTTPYYLKD